jgi:hypothetical protein
LPKERAIAKGKGGCQRKGRLPKERAIAKGKGDCQRKGRLPKERVVAKGKGGCQRKGRLPLQVYRPNNCPVLLQRSSPFSNPLLFVIPSEAEGSAVLLIV